MLRKISSCIGLLAVLLLLQACGSVRETVGGWLGSDEEEQEPITDLQDFTPLVSIERLWSEQVGSGADEYFLKLAPAVVGERVFVAERDGKVSALELTSGRQIWRRDTKIDISGGTGYAGSLVLLGSDDGEVVALTQSDGKEVWRAEVSSEVLAAPIGNSDMVVVRTADGKLYGLNATTGGRLWVYDRSNTVPSLSLRGTGTPVLANDVVIGGFDGGRLVALELNTGKLVWEARLAIPRGRSDLERMVDIDAQPVVAGGAIYAATFQGNVASVDLLSGQTQWTREMSSYAGLALDSKQAYLTDADSQVWALDRTSGASIWLQEGLKRRGLTAPGIQQGFVVVGDVEGYLHWLSASTGNFAARERLDNAPIFVAPVVAGDILLAYSSEGRLGAYRISGAKSANANTPSEPSLLDELLDIAPGVGGGDSVEQ
jgi:outer membrane protein assembly factor BamB